MPHENAQSIDAHDLEQRLRDTKKDVLKFPGHKFEFFLLPPLPEDGFVGYLTFEWADAATVDGSYHVYIASKPLIKKAKRGELGQVLRAYSVRYETPDRHEPPQESHYKFCHAQICCDKKPSDYPGLVEFLPRVIVPKSLPHLPLRTCETPVGFLLTLVAGLYGTESAAFKRLSVVEDLSKDELDLVEELRTGEVKTSPSAGQAAA